LTVRPEQQPTKGEIEEENRKVKTLRFLVDFSLAFIAQTEMPLEQARSVVQGVRSQALRLFPGKEETFDLIYLPRFRRLLNEKYNLH